MSPQGQEYLGTTHSLLLIPHFLTHHLSPLTSSLPHISPLTFSLPHLSLHSSPLTSSSLTSHLLTPHSLTPHLSFLTPHFVSSHSLTFSSAFSDIAAVLVFYSTSRHMSSCILLSCGSINPWLQLYSNYANPQHGAKVCQRETRLHVRINTTNSTNAFDLIEVPQSIT